MISVNNISKVFNKGKDNEIQVFEDFNIEFERGKCTAIIGSNGCGKSTLMNLIAGSIEMDGGEILVDDQKISDLKEEGRAKYIGRVYQDPSMGVLPSLTILENMSFADHKGKKFGLKSLVKKNRIGYYKELLSTLDLGLEDKLNTKVKDLSGGQRQSLSLIMASMKNPNILLLDEHTAALDPKTSEMIMKKTSALIKNHEITTIMISHNMRDAIEYSDRVVMLDKGKIVLDKPSDEVSEAQLLGIYRENLLNIF